MDIQKCKEELKRLLDNPETYGIYNEIEQALSFALSVIERIDEGKKLKEILEDFKQQPITSLMGDGTRVVHIDQAISAILSLVPSEVELANAMYPHMVSGAIQQIDIRDTAQALHKKIWEDDFSRDLQRDLVDNAIGGYMHDYIGMSPSDSVKRENKRNIFHIIVKMLTAYMMNFVFEKTIDKVIEIIQREDTCPRCGARLKEE